MISIARLRDDLGGGVDEERLLEIRATVIDLWERATGGLWLARTDHVETIDVEHDRVSKLWLELWPVDPDDGIDTVETRGSHALAWTEADADEFVLIGRALTRTAGYWPRFVRVTYSGGYDDGDAPAVVRHALSLQAQFMAKRMAGINLAVKSQNFEGGGGAYETAHLHPHFAETAKKNRRHV